ncbi:hypothetical protein BRADI_4g18252v3 [Brachypodium distachyon]|uniref:Uncharacterized protein n=1 Tax=Brachypodium distachyon TaxID=15368 RepID=A0A0Q3PGL0_BRADI|nr:hypothetical protein BRADI_4g18252v3 [Brachypodium distachyon]
MDKSKLQENEIWELRREDPALWSVRPCCVGIFFPHTTRTSTQIEVEQRHTAEEAQAAQQFLRFARPVEQLRVKQLHCIWSGPRTQHKRSHPVPFPSSSPSPPPPALVSMA